MTTVIFIQTHGNHAITESVLKNDANTGDLHDVLTDLGILLDADTFIFIDDAHLPLHSDRNLRLPHLKHGCRVHVGRCNQIKTTVHFLGRTETHEFPPGTRVRAVKSHAAHVFGLSPKDAAEHVLQICGSTERPASDTPLHQLVHGHGCEVCFDLIPEKRVEG